MSAEVFEICATSAHSFEDAIRQAIATAGYAVRNLRRGWVREQGRTGMGSNTEYQVKLTVTFVSDPGGSEETSAKAAVGAMAPAESVMQITGLSALDLERSFSMADEGGVSIPALESPWPPCS